MSKKTKAIEQQVKRFRRHNFAEGAYLLSREEADFLVTELEYKLSLLSRRHDNYVKHRDTNIEKSKNYQKKHYDEIKIKRHEAYLEQKRKWLAGVSED